MVYNQDSLKRQRWEHWWNASKLVQYFWVLENILCVGSVNWRIFSLQKCTLYYLACSQEVTKWSSIFGVGQGLLTFTLYWKLHRIFIHLICSLTVCMVISFLHQTVCVIMKGKHFVMWMQQGRIWQSRLTFWEKFESFLIWKFQVKTHIWRWVISYFT